MTSPPNPRSVGFYPHDTTMWRDNGRTREAMVRSNLLWHRSESGYGGDGVCFAHAWDLVYASMTAVQVGRVEADWWYDFLWQSSKREIEISNGFSHVGGYWAGIGARLDDPVLYTFGVQLYGQFVVNGFTIDGQCVGWPSCRWP